MALSFISKITDSQIFFDTTLNLDYQINQVHYIVTSLKRSLRKQLNEKIIYHFEAGLYFYTYDQLNRLSLNLLDDNCKIYENIGKLKDDFVRVKKIRVNYFSSLNRYLFVCFSILVLCFLLEHGLKFISRNWRQFKMLIEEWKIKINLNFQNLIVKFRFKRDRCLL